MNDPHNNNTSQPGSDFARPRHGSIWRLAARPFFAANDPDPYTDRWFTVVYSTPTQVIAISDSHAFLGTPMHFRRIFEIHSHGKPVPRLARNQRYLNSKPKS